MVKKFWSFRLSPHANQAGQGCCCCSMMMTSQKTLSLSLPIFKGQALGTIGTHISKFLKIHGLKIQFQKKSDTCVVWKSYGQKVLEFSSFSSRESSRPRLLLLDDDDLPKKLYYWVLCKSDLKHLNFCVSVAWFPFFALLWPRGQKLTPENYLFTFFPSLSPFFLFLSTPNIWRYLSQQTKPVHLYFTQSKILI